MLDFYRNQVVKMLNDGYSKTQAKKELGIGTAEETQYPAVRDLQS